MMRVVLISLALMNGCFIAPDPIAAPDAGPTNDAGLQNWTLLPQDNSSFGATGDANTDVDGFQIELIVQGPPQTDFAISLAGAELGQGQTDDTGAGAIAVSLVHGVHQLTLSAGNNQVIRTLNIDLIGPTFTLTTPSQSTRMPEILWSALTDDDGVGTNTVAALTFQIDQGEPETLSGNQGNHAITGLNPGVYSLLVRATDELGNPTELTRELNVGFQRFLTSHRLRYPLSGRPCAGDVNNDGRADLAILRNPANGVDIDPWILLGATQLDADNKKTLSLTGKRQAECLFAQVVSGGGDELVVSTRGDNDRVLSRFEFLHWGGDRVDGTLFHTLLETGSPAGLALGNMAVFSRGLLQDGPGEQPATDALVLQTGNAAVRIYEMARFAQASPSGIGDMELNVQMALAHSQNSRFLISGNFRRSDQPGIAIGDPRSGPRDQGAIWLLDEALAPGQSYQLNEDPGEGQFRPTHFSQNNDEEAAHLLTTVRFNDDTVDDILAANNGGGRTIPQLYVYILGEDPTILAIPDSVGDVRDLSACDLNGDGRDEISVAGRDQHQIRWGDGEWTTTMVTDETRYTLCPGDMTGDGIDDLVVVTSDTNKTLHILH